MYSRQHSCFWGLLMSFQESSKNGHLFSGSIKSAEDHRIVVEEVNVSFEFP